MIHLLIVIFALSRPVNIPERDIYDVKSQLAYYSNQPKNKSVYYEYRKSRKTGFFINPSYLPDGAILFVKPIVSADRRYVRLSLNPFFSTISEVNIFRTQ